jgi:hypothetical protein
LLSNHNELDTFLFRDKPLIRHGEGNSIEFIPDLQNCRYVITNATYVLSEVKEKSPIESFKGRL